MLHGRAGIAVTLFVFDVLVEGLAVTSQPYSERRALLEELDVEGPRVCGWWRRSRMARRCSPRCATVASRGVVAKREPRRVPAGGAAVGEAEEPRDGEVR